jgi:carbon storage regulator
MLVLSRKSRESVVVGGSDGFHRLLKVTVLGIKGTNVKLGFEVDGDVPVHRSEVWERIQAGQGLGCLREDSVTPGTLEMERDE